MKINHFLFFLLFLSLLVILSDCEEEKAVPREYPRVNTLPVTNISETGATFSADIYSLGTETIREYGFVWSQGQNPRIETEDKIVFQKSVTTPGVYTADVRSTFEEGVEYTVRPFIVTDKHIIYGKTVKFISLGSLAPVIQSFKPDTVIWGDTLKIKGKNFSYIPGKNTVRINQTVCHVISSTDSTVFAIVKSEAADTKGRISVEVSGNISLFDKKELNIKIPLISCMYPLSSRWGDSIFITGKNINAANNEFSVHIGGQDCIITEKRKDTLIVKVSERIITSANEASVKINGTVFTVSETLTVLLPEITGFVPRQGKWGDTITVSGINLMTERNNYSVTLGGLNCNVVKLNTDALGIIVPLNLFSVASDVKIMINNLMEIISPEKFELLQKIITGFSPKEGTWGDTLTLTGRFHPLAKHNRISFGVGLEAEITSVQAGGNIIKVIVPQWVRTRESVLETEADVYGSSFYFPEPFLLKPPLIESVTPLSGPPGSRVTIRGNYFIEHNRSDNHVFFGPHEGFIESWTGTEIICHVPWGIVPASETFALTVQTGDQTTTFGDKFTILKPVVSNIHPLTGYYGDIVTIEGENLLIDDVQTIVFFRSTIDHMTETEAEIISITNTRILVRVPEGIEENIPYRVSVSIAGYGYGLPQQPFVLESSGKNKQTK